MSLKKNIIASYATQIYVTLVGILILPLYLKYMGAEAYGLVGFFTMLQALFNLLDMGLTPTVARETARFRGGATDALSYRRLLRALQLIFFAVALLGGGAMFASAGMIADRWLNVQTLPLAQVHVALQLMAVGVALRWMSGLYRGCISGSERLVWLGGFNAFIATLRFVGVLPVLIWVGHTPTVFFTYQLLVAVLEVAGLAAKSYRLFPAVPPRQVLGWSPATLFAPIKPVLKFSLSIAFTSSVWVLVTQIDKLVISKILPLADYGYFTAAVLVASGITAICSPITSAVIPRLTRLHAEGDIPAVQALYRNATRLVSSAGAFVAFSLFFFAEEILFVWSGDPLLVYKTSNILRIYCLGSFVLVVSAFPSYIQYATGKMRLHIIGNILFLIIIVPFIVILSSKYGADGAAFAWLASNLFYFIFWTPVVHHEFFPGLHLRWVISDVVISSAMPFAGAMVFNEFFIFSKNRLSAAFELMMVVGSIFFLFTVSIVFFRKNKIL